MYVVLSQSLCNLFGNHGGKKSHNFVLRIQAGHKRIALVFGPLLIILLVWVTFGYI